MLAPMGLDPAISTRTNLQTTQCHSATIQRWMAARADRQLLGLLI
jgi:hypothetical protein